MAAKAESGKAQIIEQARAEGAAEAVDRLIQILMNPETAAQVPASGSSAVVQQKIAGAAAVEEPQRDEGEIPPAEAAPARPEEDEEVVISEEPYIDSFLCTSCNDCTNLNPLMFKYNSDKQAFIADPSAGTYLQLVKAAEACPANCIHPGAPSPGDETATDEVIARAKALEV
jgi:ferredoxin